MGLLRERIKDIRTKQELTQKQFGAKLGISRDAVNNLENGRAEIQEPIIKLICSEFNIDYAWLKTGEGKMYSEEDDEIQAALDDLITGQNETAKALLRIIAKLDDKDWEFVNHLLVKFEKELPHH